MKFKEMDITTKIILKVIIAGLALVFLWLIRDIILIIILSLILASAMDPMVNYFNQKKIPRAVSVLTVYVLVFGMIALFAYIFVPPIANQLKFLQDNLPQYITELKSRLNGTILGNIDFSNLVGKLVSGSGNSSEVVTKTFGVFNGVLSFITVLVVSFYLVAEEKGMKKFVESLVPHKHHEFTINLLEKIQKKMGLWLLGQIILSLSIFAFTFIGLTILGVKYALFLSLLAGILEVVPYIGPFMSAIPAVIFAFIQNPPLALAVALLYLLVQKTEGYVLVPKIMEKTVGTSPLVVLFALLIGFKLAGVIGLLIAIPLVGAIMVVFEELYAEKVV